MANIVNQDVWTENVYLIDENDVVQGGVDGVDNLPHIQLVNRTNWLKKQVEQLRLSTDNHGAIQQIQADLAQEIQDRILADNLLRGSLPSGLGEVSFKTLLDRIDVLSQQVQVLQSHLPSSSGQVVIASDVVITYQTDGGSSNEDSVHQPSLKIHGVTSSDSQLVYLSSQSSAKRQSYGSNIFTGVVRFGYPRDLVIADRGQVVVSGTDRQVDVSVDGFNKVLVLTIDLPLTFEARKQHSLHVAIRQG